MFWKDQGSLVFHGAPHSEPSLQLSIPCHGNSFTFGVFETIRYTTDAVFFICLLHMGTDVIHRIIE